MIVLVVGETADGKSTLVNAMVDHEYYWDRPDERPELLDMGSPNAKGTTQVINSYQGIKVGEPERRLVIYDSPGIGTRQCPIEVVMGQIHAQFDQGTKFQAIIVTCAATVKLLPPPSCHRHFVSNRIHSCVHISYG